MTILAQSVHTHTSITHTPPGSTAPNIDNRASEANPESLPETFFQGVDFQAPSYLPPSRASQSEVWDWYQSVKFQERGGAEAAQRMAANILGGHTDGAGYAWIDDTALRSIMTRGGFDIDLTMLRWLLSKMEGAGLVETKRRCGGKEAISVRFAERPAPSGPKTETIQSPLRLVTLTPSGKTHARRQGSKRRVSVRTPSGSGQTPSTLTLRPACPHCTVIGDDQGAGCSQCRGWGAVTIEGSVQSILTALVQSALVREHEDNEGDPSTVSDFQRMIDVAAAAPEDRAASITKPRSPPRSAAPDLLAALEEILNSTVSENGDCTYCGRSLFGGAGVEDCTWGNCPGAIARAAIAKAEGRAS